MRDVRGQLKFSYNDFFFDCALERKLVLEWPSLSFNITNVCFLYCVVEYKVRHGVGVSKFQYK